jgi:hypothetical protein
MVWSIIKRNLRGRRFANMDDLFIAVEQALASIPHPEIDNLVTFEEWVFSGCRKLELTDIPASVVKVHGGSFATAKFTNISVERGSRRLQVNGGFLVDISGLHRTSSWGEM